MPTTDLRRPAALAVTLALTATLAACSAPGVSGETGDAAEPTPTATDAADSATPPSPTGRSPFERELGALLALEDGDQETDATATKNRIEELTADCMAEQGFEYIPTDHSAFAAVTDPHQSMTPLEFAQQYGYGLSTYDLLAADTDRPTYIDPNTGALEAMSDAERHAWDVALYGKYEANDEAVPEGTPIEERGCSFQAYEEVLPTNDAEQAAIAELYDDPRFAEFLEAMWVDGEPGYREVMDAIASEWTGCMADAGYPGLEGVWAGEELVQARQQELYVVDAEGNLTSEPTTAQLTELREYEIAVATADVTCQEDIDYTAREQQARYDAEQRILDAHREDVEALKIAIQQAQAD